MIAILALTASAAIVAGIGAFGWLVVLPLITAAMKAVSVEVK